MGMSREEAISGAAQFGNFFNQIGIGTKKSLLLSKSLVQMSADLASFNNANPAEVMQAFQSATRGEYDALQKFIPTVSAATIETEALRQTHKKSAKDLTAADKALALYAISQRDMGKAQGDFARTSGGLANQQRILAAQWKDMKASLGTALLPVVTGFVTYLNKHFMPALQGLGDYLARKVPGWVETAKTAINDLKIAFKPLGSAIDFIQTGLDKLFKPQKPIGIGVKVDAPKLPKGAPNFMSTKSKQQITDIATLKPQKSALDWWEQFLIDIQPLAQAVENLAKSLERLNSAIGGSILSNKSDTDGTVDRIGRLTKAVNLLGVAVDAIAAGFKSGPTGIQAMFAPAIFIAIIGTIGSFLKTTKEQFWQGMSQIGGVVGGALGHIREQFWAGMRQIGGALSASWTWIKQVWNTALQNLKTQWSTAWNWVKTTFSAIWSGIKSRVSEAWNGLKATISTKIGEIKAKVSTVKGTVTGFFSRAGSWLLQAGRDLISGFISGIGAMAGNLIQKVQGVIGSAIDKAKSLLGIKSPSRVFAKIGKQVGEGLIIGLSSMDGKVASASGKLSTAVAKGFEAPVLAMGTDFGTTRTSGNTYNITVQAPVGASSADIGREITKHIDAYERLGGRRAS